MIIKMMVVVMMMMITIIIIQKQQHSPVLHIDVCTFCTQQLNHGCMTCFSCQVHRNPLKPAATGMITCPPLKHTQQLIALLAQLVHISPGVHKRFHRKRISILRCRVQRTVSAAHKVSSHAAINSTSASSPFRHSCRTGSSVDHKLQPRTRQICNACLTAARVLSYLQVL